MRRWIRAFRGRAPDEDYVGLGNVSSLSRLLNALAEIAPAESVLEVHHPHNAPRIVEYLLDHGSVDSAEAPFACKISATAKNLSALADLAEQSGAETIGDVFQNLFLVKGDVVLVSNFDGDEVIDVHRSLEGAGLERLQELFNRPAQ